MFFRMPTFHVLIATVGRPSLNRQLESLQKQLTADDGITVVFDGCKRQNASALDNFACPVHVFEEPVALGFWGHGVRNKYAPLLERRDFVMHGDDDDIYTEGAFDSLRHSCKESNVLYIAKMIVENGLRMRPTRPAITLGDIGTPCGIVPYELNKRGTWENFCGGDFEFYNSIRVHAPSIQFLEYPIYYVRP